MRDHQRFDTEVLPNGITLYTYNDRFRTVNLEILLPVGAAHCHEGNGFLPGSVHFLEHVQLIRSRNFPTPYQLDRELGLTGGHSDGVTYPTRTSHWVDAPAPLTDFISKAFVDRVFFPHFNSEDFTTERSVIINERNQRKYYPGKSPASRFYYSEFLHDIYYPLEQMFGSDQDLEAMTVPVMKKMHRQITHNPALSVLAVGPSDFSPLKELLSALPTEPGTFLARYDQTRWNNPEFQTVYFESIPQPTLKTAWVLPRLTFEEYQSVSFILSLLINTTHGALYQEFREEKGWVYGLDGYCSQREQACTFGLSFPVNDTQQVGYIRDCLHDRIVKAVQDQDLVSKEIRRHKGSQVYNYQTAGEIVSAASQDLITYGAIHSEKEWLLCLEKMTDPAWRTYLLDTFFKKEEMGSLCFMPERRRMVPIREAPVVS
jgi:predicted Zn-dependent peptidase